ncbi:ppGpp synthetase/RelA/SpoT-type nucleotidyltransferase [Lentzea atacamensis]|uniref:PpGpp synthetase/RelA/SpoT-type nucleotidyltransferase n=1 Tax=Lentzea atacamensis TaxID=531938 RepID=A0ABX9EEE5_9PSEU|nr:hypothetical protein [Lentzea atacamensis]RAS69012.1 ppGpp synthetase/RelA/SpoT-type nucleotidyltransferase [Lentzea atacamensis]
MTSPSWKTQYAEIRPKYEAYEKKLKELVETVLTHAKIDVVQVEGRVKTLDSFAEKIDRKDGKYTDPLKDMTDLVGLRIIAYYVEDVEQIAALLRSQFTVLEEHSANKQDALAPDQFGYASNHLVIRLGNDRCSLPEWSRYADIAVELQVRTTLQHAWAAVHHKLSYKRAEEVPTSLQRRLFRLSALFEMADEQFSAIRTAASELSDEYSDNVKQGNLDIEIDADSLGAYLRNSPKVALIRRVASEDFNHEIPADDSFRSELIQLATHLGAKTIDEFDRLLPGDAETITSVLTAGGRTYRSVYAALAIFCAALHPVDEDFYKSLFAKSSWPIILEIKAKLGEPGQAGSPDQVSR